MMFSVASQKRLLGRFCEASLINHPPDEVWPHSSAPIPADDTACAPRHRPRRHARIERRPFRQRRRNDQPRREPLGCPYTLSLRAPKRHVEKHQVDRFMHRPAARSAPLDNTLQPNLARMSRAMARQTPGSSAIKIVLRRPCPTSGGRGCCRAGETASPSQRLWASSCWSAASLAATSARHCSSTSICTWLLKMAGAHSSASGTGCGFASIMEIRVQGERFLLSKFGVVGEISEAGADGRYRHHKHRPRFCRVQAKKTTGSTGDTGKYAQNRPGIFAVFPRVSRAPRGSYPKKCQFYAKIPWSSSGQRSE